MEAGIKTLGNVSLANKNVLNNLTEINIAGEMCHSRFCAPESPLGRTLRSSREIEPGNDIISVHQRHSYINLSSA